MTDLTKILLDRLQRQNETIARMEQALAEKGITDAWWDGYKAAIASVESFTIRIAPEYDLIFNHVKTETVAMLKKSLPHG